jgi:large subunit ribosomal protein L25
MDAQVREATGKGHNRRLRQNGDVPAVLYGKAAQPVSLIVKEKDVRRALATSAGLNVVVNLTVKNGKDNNVTARIQQVQQDHFAKYVLHVDFHQVSLSEKIHATVKLNLKGVAAIEKAGGVVSHDLWEIEVEGPVSAIPEHVDVDLSTLKVGDSLHAKDIKLPEGLTLRSGADEQVAAIHSPKAEAEGEAAAPAATPAA